MISFFDPSLYITASTIPSSVTVSSVRNTVFDGLTFISIESIATAISSYVISNVRLFETDTVILPPLEENPDAAVTVYLSSARTVTAP